MPPGVHKGLQDPVPQGGFPGGPQSCSPRKFLQENLPTVGPPLECQVVPAWGPYVLSTKRGFPKGGVHLRGGPVRNGLRTCALVALVVVTYGIFTCAVVTFSVFTCADFHCAVASFLVVNYAVVTCAVVTCAVVICVRSPRKCPTRMWPPPT